MKFFNKEYMWFGEKVLLVKLYDIIVIGVNDVVVSLFLEKKI